MNFYHLTGSPRQRGRIHGEEMRTQIASVFELWKADIEKDTGLSSKEYIARFTAETNFLPTVERWTPDLLEEVRGLAEGAGQGFNEMFAFQCMDEDWWFRETCQREHCSTIGLQVAGEAPILAQNMDIHRMTDGYQALLHITENDLQVLIFSFAGFIGLTGLNNRPLGVCVNTLSQLNSSNDGLPVAFVVRGLLNRSNLDDAENFLHDIKHASGQNYMLGGMTRISGFEASAAGVAVYDKGSESLCHTNHPLASQDYRSGEKEQSNPPVVTNSHERLDRITACTKADRVDVSTIKEVLKTKPVCRELEPQKDFFTSGSLVMTLSSLPMLEITAGPPSQNEYNKFTFS